MAAAEAYFDSLKGDKYKKKYLDKFPLGKSPKNPICNVVPLTEEDFFGPYVCNVIVLTGIYKDWSSSSVGAAKARLIATYAKFTKYELHIMIDKTADNIINADTGDLNTMDNDLTTLAAALADYGVTYYGKLEEGELKAKIALILKTFYNE